MSESPPAPTPPPRAAARSRSRVRIIPSDSYTTPRSRTSRPPPLPPLQSVAQPHRPQFHTPDYTSPAFHPPESSVFPQEDDDSSVYSRRDSILEVPPSDSRRGSGESDKTLNDGQRGDRYNLSSYDHPYDIPPPQNAYSGPGPSAAQSQPLRSAIRRSVSFAEQPRVREYVPTEEDVLDKDTERALKRRSVLSNMLDLHAIDNSPGKVKDKLGDPIRRNSSGSDDGSKGATTARPFMRRADSMASMTSMGSDILDPDDPRVTGVEKEYLEDQEDVEKNALRQMDYRSRRKHLQRIRIQFNVTCKCSYIRSHCLTHPPAMINRQEFLIKLARSLMSFGAPSHRIESQLVSAARILEVEAEFIHLPGVIICSFGDQELGCSETHFVKCGGRLSLGALHKVHVVYRSVVHDEISAKKATEQLDDLLNAPPLYPIFFRCVLSFCLSALICPLAFGGSFLDMWIAGASAFTLSILQLYVATKSAMYANVFE